jgi:hypothetical protein
MKREYMTPKVELVQFNFDDQVVVASGGTVGTYGSGHNIGRCQQGTTSCTYYYVKPSGCGNENWPEGY